jgi:molybdopterin converting factor small subunit
MAWQAVLTMILRVLFFSVLQDITGTKMVDVPCFEGATVSDLLALIYAKWPTMGDWDASLLIAVDQAYVKRTAILYHNNEVAIMPPVQGG